jgi:hypothetical protein
MKIAVHVKQLDQRGCGTVAYDYSAGIRDHLGIEPVIISSRPESTSPIEKYTEFKCELYESESEIPYIIDKENIDLFYTAKAGGRSEGLLPTNCKNAIHCIFSMEEPHGDVYAGVSEWLAKRFDRKEWVPHMVNLPDTNETLHEELGIPMDAFVVGRLGGSKQFDLIFAKQALMYALQNRKDMWAIFLNTEKFVEHPRVKFLPYNPSNFYKTKFINTCDAMLHARSDGETFGLAVAEFSSRNKPIFTYDAPYWWYMRAHIDILGEKALLYKDGNDLIAYLMQIDKNYVKDVNWDCYSTKFSPKNVMKQFKQVFIDNENSIS